MNQQTSEEVYRMLYYLRYVEDVIGSEYKKGHMKCPVHLYTGQEAIAAGVCLNLDKNDFVTTNHRSHGHYLAKGGDLRGLLEEIHCMPSGCTNGWGGSQHPYAPEVGILGTSAIVSGGIPIAAGIAQTLLWEKRQSVSVVFFGDGATEEGNFYETLNYAAIKSLPVLFVCENNGLAVHSPLENRRPPGVRLHRIAESLGVDAESLDGNDVVSIYDTAKRVIASMKAAPHPFFIEAETFRWKGHVSPDEDHGERYRNVEDIERWKKNCPLKKFRSLLMRNNVLTEAEITGIEQDVETTLDSIMNDIHCHLSAEGAACAPSTPY